MYSFYKAYAGTGNPDAPSEVLKQIAHIAKMLDEKEYTLRSGRGLGPDMAFENNSTRKEIYLPWYKFNVQDPSNTPVADENTVIYNRVSKEALEAIKPFTPTFDNLKDSVKIILGRSVHLMLGKDMKSPVKFLVCWTQDGCESAKNRTSKTGYTGLAISIASAIKVPVFNLKNTDAMNRLSAYIRDE